MDLEYIRKRAKHGEIIDHAYLKDPALLLLLWMLGLKNRHPPPIDTSPGLATLVRCFVGHSIETQFYCHHWHSPLVVLAPALLSISSEKLAKCMEHNYVAFYIPTCDVF